MTDDFVPIWDDFVPFPDSRDLRCTMQLPNASGIYGVYLNAKLLYVGQSRNFRNRWWQHERLDFARIFGIKHLMVYIKRASLLKLNDLEKEYVSTHEPPYNVRLMAGSRKARLTRMSLKFTEHRETICYGCEKVQEMAGKIENLQCYYCGCKYVVLKEFYDREERGDLVDLPKYTPPVSRYTPKPKRWPTLVDLIHKESLRSLRR